MKESVRLYHLIAVNDRTNGRRWLTRTPVSHDEACTIRGKFSAHRDVRILLTEATTAAPLNHDGTPETADRFTVTCVGDQPPPTGFVWDHPNE